MTDAIYISIEGLEGDEPLYLSPIGTPIKDVVRIQAGRYQISENEYIEFEGIDLYAVLLTLAQPKRIVKTYITGRDSSIKQFISLDDVQINCSGVILNGRDRKYPIELVQKLIAIAQARTPLGVSSRLISLMGVTHMVIEEITLEPREGYEGVQYFKFTAVSDDPVEVDLIEV